MPHYLFIITTIAFVMYAEAQVTCPDGMFADSPGPKRAINLNQLIINSNFLLTRFTDTQIRSQMELLIQRLSAITPADTEMLANSHRSSDNELVDMVFKANNLVNQLLEATDAELASNPPGLGALIMDSNDIAEYQQKQKAEQITSERQL